MSSNPFRKTTSEKIEPPRAGSPRSSLRSENPLTAGRRKTKPVKRVRVLSPPPLSPESPTWQPYDEQPPAPLSDNDAANHVNHYTSSDPFNGAFKNESSRENTPLPPPPSELQPQQQVRTPANPFSKPSQDAQGSGQLQKERVEEGEALKAASTGGKTLNVDSFRRLLMTGIASPENIPPPTANDEVGSQEPAASLPSPSSDAAPNLAGAGIGESLTSSSASEDEDDERSQYAVPSRPSQQDRKIPPPPPPSSRHGKSLRQSDLSEGPRGFRSHARQVSMDDLSLAGAGQRGTEDELTIVTGHDGAPSATDEPVVDVESPVTPVNSAPKRISMSKKLAPTPPPPRGRVRSDSKSTDHPSGQRTSMDEAVPHRSDSVKSSGNAPMPPPPRRPHMAPRPASQPSTPMVPSSTFSAQTSPSTEHGKPDDSTSFAAEVTPSAPSASSAPRPPPARNSSTRRAPSIHSIDAPSRRVSLENRREGTHAPLPPPPPPRHHGNSFSDGATSTTPTASSGKSADILADLDALQREVDALRGQMK